MPENEGLVWNRVWSHPESLGCREGLTARVGCDGGRAGVTCRQELSTSVRGASESRRELRGHGNAWRGKAVAANEHRGRRRGNDGKAKGEGLAAVAGPRVGLGVPW